MIIEFLGENMVWYEPFDRIGLGFKILLFPVFWVKNCIFYFWRICLKITTNKILIWILFLLFFLTVYPFVILLTLTPLIWLYRKAADSNANAEKEASEKRANLLSSPAYKYVKDFAKKYPLKYDCKSTNELYRNSNGAITVVDLQGFQESIKELENLSELLNKEGVELSDEELRKLVFEETTVQEIGLFENRLKYYNPKQLKDYLAAFLETYSSDDARGLSILKKTLEKRKIQFNEDNINDELAAAKKELDLNHFKKKLESTNETKYCLEDLDLMSGHDFEKFLRQLFEKMGYKVELTKLSNDQGADLVIGKFGEKIVVQAKRYNHPVSNKAIQEVVASIKHYKADRGLVVTTNDFTKPAMNLASSNNIELIDRAKLKKMMDKCF